MLPRSGRQVAASLNAGFPGARRSGAGPWAGSPRTLSPGDQAGGPGGRPSRWAIGRGESQTPKPGCVRKPCGSWRDGARTPGGRGEMEMVFGVPFLDLGKGGGILERISSSVFRSSCCVSSLTSPLKTSPNLVGKDSRPPLACPFFSPGFLLICFSSLPVQLSVFCLTPPCSAVFLPVSGLPVSVSPCLCLHAVSLHFSVFPVFPSVSPLC